MLEIFTSLQEEIKALAQVPFLHFFKADDQTLHSCLIKIKPFWPPHALIQEQVSATFESRLGGRIGGVTLFVVKNTSEDYTYIFWK